MTSKTKQKRASRIVNEQTEQNGKPLQDAAKPAPLFTGLRDFAYKFSRQDDVRNSFGLFAPQFFAKWPEVSDDERAEFNAGCAIRSAELIAPVWYRKEGKDNYVSPTTVQPADAGSADSSWLCLSVAYAMGYTAQQVGALGAESPNLKALIMGVRKKVQDYAARKMQALKQAYAKSQEVKGDAKHARPANEVISDFAKGIVKKMAAAMSRGDAKALDEAHAKEFAKGIEALYDRLYADQVAASNAALAKKSGK